MWIRTTYIVTNLKDTSQVARNYPDKIRIQKGSKDMESTLNLSELETNEVVQLSERLKNLEQEVFFFFFFFCNM